MFYFQLIKWPPGTTYATQWQRAGSFYVFHCTVRLDLQKCGPRIFGLEINRLLHKAITRALYFVNMSLKHHGRIRLYVFLVQIRYEILWCCSPHPKFGPSVLYLVWFSDASIMALNLEFSSASKTAGLSNSKIYENEKNKTVIGASI